MPRNIYQRFATGGCASFISPDPPCCAAPSSNPDGHSMLRCRSRPCWWRTGGAHGLNTIFARAGFHAAGMLSFGPRVMRTFGLLEPHHSEWRRKPFQTTIKDYTTQGIGDRACRPFIWRMTVLGQSASRPGYAPLPGGRHRSNACLPKTTEFVHSSPQRRKPSPSTARAATDDRAVRNARAADQTWRGLRRTIHGIIKPDQTTKLASFSRQLGHELVTGLGTCPNMRAAPRSGFRNLIAAKNHSRFRTIVSSFAVGVDESAHVHGSLS